MTTRPLDLADQLADDIRAGVQAITTAQHRAAELRSSISNTTGGTTWVEFEPHEIRTLSGMQRAFAYAVGQLITHISTTPGYAVTLGDAYRDPRTFGEVGTRKGYGSARSVHKSRLAIDLNLFKRSGSGGGWRYLTSSRSHQPFGTWWVELGKVIHVPLRWGGNFSNADGNHYSCEWEGRM